MIDLPLKLREGEAMAAARDGDTSAIVSLLRSGIYLSWEVRNFVADVVEGKLKHPKGRPEERQFQKVLRWYAQPENFAAAIAECKIRAWRRRLGLVNRVRGRDGKLVPVHEEAARRAVAFCKRQRPDFPDLDHDRVVERLRKGRTSPFK